MQARCLEFVQLVERNFEFYKLLISFQAFHAVNTLHEVVGFVLLHNDVCFALLQTFLLSTSTEFKLRLFILHLDAVWELIFAKFLHLRFYAF